ncbi:GNAT family N-acetyltransferase [Lysinibacillus capsici]|uniref:GNAT family N-acetyltransferase n=1 Tax=Lysinibacillus capsici TaxID=2115968 RepID=UPI001B5AF6EA|nr:GNAT family N-acetyltransferase [Lysinibacillus capsici]
MIIREATRHDSERIIAVMANAEASNFMLFGPGERNLAPKPFGEYIDKLYHSHHSALFIAEMDEQVVAYLIVQGNEPSRIAHRAYLVIGIHSDYRGRKIGTALFQHVENWAIVNGVHRLELTVMENNEAGVALYKKMGFDIEGMKRASLYVDGQYINEYYMSKLLIGKGTTV